MDLNKPSREEEARLKEADKINAKFDKQVDTLDAQVRREGNTEASNIAATKLIQGLDNTRSRKVKEALSSEGSPSVEPQAEEQKPDYGSMPASNIGEAIGALGGDEWKEQVRRFDNAPIWELLGIENPRKTLPDWLFVDRGSLPPKSTSENSPFEQLKERFNQEAPPAEQVEPPTLLPEFDPKEWEMYDLLLGENMPENPYPERTWKDSITSPMGRLAYDSHMHNKNGVIGATNFEEYFGEGVSFLPAIRNRFKESLGRRRSNGDGNIDFGYGMDTEAWENPMAPEDDVLDALQFMLKKGDFVYHNDNIYLASEYNFSQRDTGGDPYNLDITDVPYLLERFSTDATKGDLWVGKSGFSLGDKLLSMMGTDDAIEGPSIRIDLGTYYDLGLSEEEFNELKRISNSAQGLMGNHSLKSIVEYENWKSGLKSINPKNMGWNPDDTIGGQGKWAGVSEETKKEVERGAKKRKEAKKKTDAMGLTKVGKTRAKAAKKVREYSDKFNELTGR